ncbi:hypothetical protein HPB48_018282 [Haemaphysalis longicornis]|uniref:Uncharacterized protein n=1 Tax=Haemaphysalis longicornis TaxID=44386 RepID=A0A9J6GAE0_HAELO|nr:hypothetical protein HPB48_018282 [Haemaphysalis longicornis]
MKEMLRVIGLNDWVYWIGHYLSEYYMHVVISTLMMLFVSVKRNREGRPFIYYSDPFLLFWILMHFSHSCLMHAILVSLFFSSRKFGNRLHYTCYNDAYYFKRVVSGEFLTAPDFISESVTI